MTDYTAAEACMRRMIVVRNHLEVLHHLAFEGGVNPSVTSYYGILHLLEFTGSYHGMMEHLNPDEKEQVLCITDLIAGVIGCQKALQEVRNNWIAHLQEYDRFIEDASDFARRVGLPDNPEAYHEMFISTIAFVDTVRALLPDIAGPAVEKFNRSGDAASTLYEFSPDRAMQNARARLEAARNNAEKKFPNLEWDLLLGAVGVRLEQLGRDASRADARLEDRLRKRGADRG